jgi:hypothetical protein
MLARMQRRVAMTTTDDLLSWADTATYGIQRQFDDFRKKPDEAHLAEIKLAAATLDAVADELAVRIKQAKGLT